MCRIGNRETFNRGFTPPVPTVTPNSSDLRANTTMLYSLLAF